VRRTNSLNPEQLNLARLRGWWRLRIVLLLQGREHEFLAFLVTFCVQGESFSVQDVSRAKAAHLIYLSRKVIGIGPVRMYLSAFECTFRDPDEDGLRYSGFNRRSIEKSDNDGTKFEITSGTDIAALADIRFSIGHTSVFSFICCSFGQRGSCRGKRPSERLLLAAI
jgi:hypothetical protein